MDNRIRKIVGVLIFFILIIMLIVVFFIAKNLVKDSPVKKQKNIESEFSEDGEYTFETELIVRVEDSYKEDIEAFKVSSLFNIQSQDSKLEQYLERRGLSDKKDFYLSLIGDIKDEYLNILNNIDFVNPGDVGSNGLYIESPITSVDLSKYTNKYSKFYITGLDVLYCLDDKTAVFEYIPADSNSNNTRFIVASLDNLYVGKNINKKYDVGDAFYLYVAKGGYLEKTMGDTKVVFVKG